MTADQVKAKFKRDGITITQWAQQNGFGRHYVYLVLNGQVKAQWGKGHEIAVALGMKPSVN
ncbi:MAG: DNA-binding protein [Gallionella sp.]